MADSANPRYGTLNWPMLQEWFSREPEDDGQFWAINLMKYRDIADYSDGRETTLTGEEADDIYAPVDIFEPLGASLVFGSRVVAQPVGNPDWDRIAIVRYPSRARFFEMQRMPEFVDRHEHKDAGMEFTIVMSCDPRELPAQQPTVEHGSLVMSVRRFADGAASTAEAAGVTPVAHFDVEGPVVGDERRWHEVRFDRVAEGSLDAYVAAGAAEEQIVVVLNEDQIIDTGVLVESIASRS